MKKIIILLIVFLTVVELSAQQDPHYTHYMFNTLTVNPAYAGSRDALTVTGLYRNQWVGFKGAPFTQTLSVHSPVLNNKLGLGLTLVNDRIGPTNNTSVFADFAYRIPLGKSKKAKLALGIKGGLDIKQFRLSEVALRNESDPEFTTYNNKLLPNVGFGIYYSTDNFYLGAAVPKILENYYDKNRDGKETADNSRQRRHYNFIMGAVFKLSKSLKLKPTMLVKVLESAPPTLDLTASLLIKDVVWTGLAFRTASKSIDAVSLLLGVNITKQFAVGYSFDYSITNESFKHNWGSHELMLRYDFIFKKRIKIKSPRYF